MIKFREVSSGDKHLGKDCRRCGEKLTYGDKYSVKAFGYEVLCEPFGKALDPSIDD